jgi:hypothetical protein
MGSHFGRRDVHGCSVGSLSKRWPGVDGGTQEEEEEKGFARWDFINQRLFRWGRHRPESSITGTGQ